MSLARRALKDKFPTPTVPLTTVLPNRQVFLPDSVYRRMNDSKETSQNKIEKLKLVLLYAPFLALLGSDRNIYTSFPRFLFIIAQFISFYLLFFMFHKLQVVLDGWLNVHRSITLIEFQLDAQNSYIYIYIYNTFIKISVNKKGPT